MPSGEAHLFRPLATLFRRGAFFGTLHERFAAEFSNVLSQAFVGAAAIAATTAADAARWDDLAMLEQCQV